MDKAGQMPTFLARGEVVQVDWHHKPDDHEPAIVVDMGDSFVVLRFPGEALNRVFEHCKGNTFRHWRESTGELGSIVTVERPNA